MESWGYLSEGKGICFGNEMDLPIDSFGENRNSIVVTDKKPSNNLDNDGLMSELMDIGFPDLARKTTSSISSETDRESGVKVASSCLIASNLSFRKKEYFPKLSNSLVESNDQEFSIIDLKFGKDRSVVSSHSPAPRAKKARTIGSCSQKPLCQVYGCNIDLSSSKDYHKRHRVCEVHSKTAKVIVNGIEQRFCQQCSRFHLLAEFDDGKRSCRRRLAGHNERRRKPPFHFPSSKQHKLLHSFQGSKFFDGSVTKRLTFGLPEVYSGGFLCEERYEQNNKCRIIKFEDNSINCPRPAISFLQQKPSLSSCALSLLSSQSQDFLDQVAEIPNFGFSRGGCVHQNIDQNFGKRLDISPMEKDLPKGFRSSGSIQMSTGHMGSIMVDSCHSNAFEVQTEAFFQDSTFSIPGHCFPPQNGSTLDLFQLSSHLQRVEQQRSSVQVKHEHMDEPCYFLGT